MVQPPSAKPRIVLPFLVGLESLGNGILPTRIFSMRQEIKVAFSRKTTPVVVNGIRLAAACGCSGGHLGCRRGRHLAARNSNSERGSDDEARVMLRRAGCPARSLYVLTMGPAHAPRVVCSVRSRRLEAVVDVMLNEGRARIQESR